MTCPCGSDRPYPACCGRLHAGAAQARTAEELMRSRYSAFAVGDVAYLVRSWHPRTRPPDLALDGGQTWTGLTVTATEAGGPGDEEGVVSFEASYRTPEGRGVLQETSRFERRRGRWVYVEAVPS
jgi:SEC-C motif-containing protein